MISDDNIRVNRDLCYACGICVDRCILDNLRLSLGPCRTACPIHMNCQGYIRLLAQDKKREAAEEIRKYTPFGALLGRVCSAPCERECERKIIDDPVHIRALKRYLCEEFPEIVFRVEAPSKESGLSVAVVGSGPAGLTAGYRLRSNGHRVTIFESKTEPGGLLRWGIPEFRLPRDVLDRTVRMVEQIGVTFKTGFSIGRDIELDRLTREFDAVILAVGGGPSKKLDLPGADLKGVYDALDLLSRVRDGERVPIGNSTIVIGGGNTAVDAAISCRLLGAQKVHIVALEAGGSMPASMNEIEEANQMGIRIENCWGPLSFNRSKTGRLEVLLSRCLSVFDENGTFAPTLENSCGLQLECDSVVVAAGQKHSSVDWPEELFDSHGYRFNADPVTRMSSCFKNLFVCGDSLPGSGSVVSAMASADEAAISADRLLAGEALGWGRNIWSHGFCREYEPDHSRAKGGHRHRLTRIEVSSRSLKLPFEQPLESKIAQREAERCLSCGRAYEANLTCWYCLPCEIECPVKALEVNLPYLVR